VKFSHSQDQLDLRDAARDYFRGSCTAEALRTLVENNQSSLNNWQELAELGLLGYLAAEDLGGLNMSIDGFVLLAEEAGYVALPEPLLEVSGIALPVLSGIQSEASNTLIKQICAGEQRVMLSHPLNPNINQLDKTDSVLLLQNDGAYLIPAAECGLVSSESIDPLRRIQRLEASPAAQYKLVEKDAVTDLERQAVELGALITAAELLGLSAGMIEMTTEYAKERKQFGHPIGSYQAVKHHLSNAFVALEFARPVIYRAAAAISQKEANALLSVAHAKIAAIDVATLAAETAIQIHGGMGYTFEVDLHLWMKRVWAISGLWGDRNYHARIIDQALFADNLATGPSSNFS